MVFALPLYYWMIIGVLKTTFDRLFSAAECGSNYTNPTKERVLLMAAEGDEFEGSLYWCNRLETHLGWHSLSKVILSTPGAAMAETVMSGIHHTLRASHGESRP